MRRDHLRLIASNLDGVPPPRVVRAPLLVLAMVVALALLARAIW